MDNKSHKVRYAAPSRCIQVLIMKRVPVQKALCSPFSCSDYHTGCDGCGCASIHPSCCLGNLLRSTHAQASMNLERAQESVFLMKTFRKFLCSSFWVSPHRTVRKPGCPLTEPFASLGVLSQNRYFKKPRLSIHQEDSWNNFKWHV